MAQEAPGWVLYVVLFIFVLAIGFGIYSKVMLVKCLAANPDDPTKCESLMPRPGRRRRNRGPALLNVQL